MTSLALLMLSLTLLVPAQLEAQSVSGNKREQHTVVTHFGNCDTPEYGPGICVYRRECGFTEANLLTTNNRDCHSQLRPQLVCCPQDENRSPLSRPHVAINKTNIPTQQHSRTANPGQRKSPSASAVPLPATLSRADELPKHPHCGTTFAFKVYGGSNTELFEFPWTTLLEYTISTLGQKQHSCGASFIAQRWLLTAAHCVHETILGKSRKLTGALLGEWDTTSNPDCITYYNGNRECAPQHIHATIDRQIMHHLFELGNLTNDIALLRLAEPVDWRQFRHVEPVCLPSARDARADQLIGSAVDVSGWGLTKNSNQPSVVKRKAELYVKPQELCRETFGKNGFTFTNAQLCASGGINVDSCLGDSGGPLTVEAYTPQRDRYVYLAGIVSYGTDLCGKSDFPGAYTRVSSYMDWIEQTIRNNSDGSLSTH